MMKIGGHVLSFFFCNHFGLSIIQKTCFSHNPNITKQENLKLIWFLFIIECFLRKIWDSSGVVKNHVNKFLKFRVGKGSQASDSKIPDFTFAKKIFKLMAILISVYDSLKFQKYFLMFSCRYVFVYFLYHHTGKMIHLRIPSLH